jgi:hypothetical protein
MKFEELKSNAAYVLGLVDSCLGNPINPEQRIYNRLELIGEIFFGVGKDFSHYKKGIEEVYKTIHKDLSPENLFIPENFEENFHTSLKIFEGRLLEEPEMSNRAEQIKFILSISPKGDILGGLCATLKKSEFFEDILAQVKGQSLTYEELDTAINRTLELIKNLDRESPSELMLELSDALLDLEDKSNFTLLATETYKQLFEICSYSNNPRDTIRTLMYHCCVNNDNIGTHAAEHLSLEFKRLYSHIDFNDAPRFLSGILYGIYDSSIDGHISEEFKASLETILYRLNKVDPKMFNSESIKSVLRDFGCDDGDGDKFDENPLNTGPLTGSSK